MLQAVKGGSNSVQPYLSAFGGDRGHRLSTLTMAVAGPWVQICHLAAAQAGISLWPQVTSRPPPLAHSSLPLSLQICLSLQDMNHSVSLFRTPKHYIFAHHNRVHLFRSLWIFISHSVLQARGRFLSHLLGLEWHV